MTFDGSTPLSDARDWLLPQIGVKKKGAKCPLCHQLTKAYPRAVHSKVAYALIVMWRRNGRGWFHHPSLKHLWGTNDTFNLQYYGLLQPRGDVRDDGGHAGWWRVTAKGERFVRGEIRVPVAWVFDGEVVGFDFDNPVDIHDALADDFNYRDLMNGVR